MAATPWLVCDFCGRTFPTNGSLARHVAYDHGGRPFAPRCAICGETFESPADLQAHHRGVHGSGG